MKWKRDEEAKEDKKGRKEEDLKANARDSMSRADANVNRRML